MEIVKTEIGDRSASQNLVYRVDEVSGTDDVGRYDLSMLDLKIDREIANIMPDPEPVEERDARETGDGAEDFAGVFDRKKLWLNNLRESLERSGKFESHVPILVWRGKNVIVDGIQRYKLCREMGITPKIELMDFPDKAAAIRERWRRNVSSVRQLSEFAKAEQIFRFWNKYFKPEWDTNKNKGGRGRRADKRYDQIEEKGKLAGLKRAQMAKVERILRYVDNPNRKMPQELLDNILRRLRNGMMQIGSANGNIIGFDGRLTRKTMNRQTLVGDLNPVDWSAPKATRTDPIVRSAWSGETNVVIEGDCLTVLSQIPAGAIDRFVFSPPYYLADGSSDDWIRYGEEYKPFASWDHYCNWTLRYLAQMWRILPEGGHIVVNIDNTREPKQRRARDKNGCIRIGKNGKPMMEPNPLAGKFYYHSDLIRYLMSNIGCMMTWMDELGVDKNPLHADLHEWRELYGWPKYDWNAPDGFDVGEYIWAKSQAVAKRAAFGSPNSPQRRPNHEYVLFFRKGVAQKQASTMSDLDMQKATFSSWEDVAQPEAGDQELWGGYWSIPGTADRQGEHAAPFPRALAYRMVTFGGSVNDIICDPFAGTGTTLFVAARTGRQYVGIELTKNHAPRAHRSGVEGQKLYREKNVINVAQEGDPAIAPQAL